MNRETSRRRFLKDSAEVAALTAAVSTLGSVHSAAAEKPTKVNLGIIGCGGIMGMHVQGLVSRRDPVSLTWFCDVDPRQIDKYSQYVDRKSVV